MISCENGKNKNQCNADAGQAKNQATRHHDPFAVLRLHSNKKTATICVFSPNTAKVSILPRVRQLTRMPEAGVFESSVVSSAINELYQLNQVHYSDKQSIEYDAGSHPLQLLDHDHHRLPLAYRH